MKIKTSFAALTLGVVLLPSMLMAADPLFCSRAVVSEKTGETLYCTRDMSLEVGDDRCTCGTVSHDEGSDATDLPKSLPVEEVPVDPPVEDAPPVCTGDCPPSNV